MSSGSLDPLPDEIIEHILTFLSAPELAKFNMASNIRLLKIVKKSITLEYSTQLQICGMLDGKGNMLVANKLRKLRETEDNWNSNVLCKRHVFDGVVDLKGIRRPGNVHSSYVANEYDLVCWIETVDGEEGYLDLVVHLTEGSTGRPHPLAEQPYIHTELRTTPEEAGDIKCDVQVVGSRLVLIMCGLPESGLLLLDWQIGQILVTEKLVHDADNPEIEIHASFIFLTPDLLFLPNSETKAFEIIRLPNGKKPFNHRKFERIAYLLLPRLSFGDSIAVDEIRCEVNPNPIGFPIPSRLCNAQSGFTVGSESPQSPFYADPQQAIILIRIMTLVLMIRRKTVLDVVNAATENGEAVVDEYTSVLVPWADWTNGPNGCVVRWCTSSVLDTVVTSGQRVIYILHSGSHVMKNFNPHAVMRSRDAIRSRNSRTSETGLGGDDEQEQQTALRFPEARVDSIEKCFQKSEGIWVRVRLVESEEIDSGVSSYVREEPDSFLEQERHGMPYVETMVVFDESRNDQPVGGE